MRAIAVALVVALLQAAGSVSGNWRGHFRVDGADHDIPQLIELREDGKNLTGTGGPDEAERYPIAHGHVDGQRVTFEITTGDWKFFYDLKNTGGLLTGKLTLKSATSTRTAEVSLKSVE